MTLSSTQSTARSTKRYRNAGLQHTKVWVHPSEADDVRNYARKKPLTRAILRALRDL